jgi:RNA:NAD 2'-phosphotransferase (TPT1/KptA family)
MIAAQNGLSKMNRNHIHLAQGIPGDGVISGEH